MIKAFLPQERRLFFIAIIIFILATISRTTIAIKENSEFVPIAGGVYKEGIVGQPIYVNPIISSNQTDIDIAALVYSPLSQFIENSEIQDQGKSYIVVLKEKLFWSDGQPLTSDDVVFTIKLIQNPETQSPLFNNWQNIDVERLSEIKLKFLLPTPYVFFVEQLNHLPIIPKHIFGDIPSANLKLSRYSLEPTVSSGPYYFESFSKKDNGFITEYQLKINQYYSGPKPYIKNFIFKFYENEDDLLKAFQLRKIDGFGTLKPFNFNEFIPKNAIIHKINMPRTYALFFNSKVNPLLKDKKFRQALAEAINKEELIKFVFENNIQIPLPEKQQTTTNREALAKLIEKNKNNLELTITLPDIEFLKKTAEFVQNSWQKAGIPKVNIAPLPSTELINDVIRYRKYEILLFGQILENPQDLFPFWHSSQSFHPGLNFALYENKKVDQLVEKIRQEFEESNRLNQLKEIERIINEDKPMIALYSLPYIYIHFEKLRGFDDKELITNPFQRFDNVNQWYTKAVRVIK
jgi:peptide/nickel transport system substrate-binding protein